MDRLWSPWRFEYVRQLDSARPDGGCVFCALRTESDDRANLVLYRGANAFLLLNLYPYTAGHLLVAANRHIPFLRDARPEELHEFLELAQRAEAALAAAYRPDGFNIGFNLGQAAGAGIADHLHMHILPRWTGDANFVSVVGETRVLPEALSSTYDRLLPHFR
jgi:ATP adenylyltransferase